jgi:hypothetical protein
MLNLPNRLYQGFKLLTKSRLCRNEHTDAESLQHFQQILNNSQPETPDEKLLYNLVHGMFLEGHNKFINYIRNTKMECFVLWCDARSIIRACNLQQVAYIRWDNNVRNYSVEVYKPPVKQPPVPQTSDHPLMNFLMTTAMVADNTPVPEKYPQLPKASPKKNHTALTPTNTDNSDTNDDGEVEPGGYDLSTIIVSGRNWGDITDSDE